jgi:hypothetical protein
MREESIENAFIENFNGRLRERVLERLLVNHLFDARRQIGAWREHCNHIRPPFGSDAAPSRHKPLPLKTSAWMGALSW